MLSTSYTYLKKEIYLTENEKLSPEYFSSMADFYIASLVREKYHITMARNYYSSTRDNLDFQFLEDMYGMQNPIDLGFTNIIKPRVDALVGLSLMSEPEFTVAYVDEETIKKVKKEKLEGTIRDINLELQSAISNGITAANEAQKAGAQPQPQSANPTKGDIDILQKIADRYGESFISSYETSAQHILNFIQSDSEIDFANLKKEVSKDYFTTGEAYTKDIYKGEGKDPKKIFVRPEHLFSNRPKHDKDFTNTDVVVTRKQVSVHNILKELGDVITKKDAEDIVTRYSALGAEVHLMVGPVDVMLDPEDLHQMDRAVGNTGYSNGYSSLVGDDVTLYHVEWLASTRIPSGNGGYVYREDRYECYRVGGDIYIGGRKCDEAPRKQDAPWKTTLSYKAVVNASPNGVIESMVNSLREIQDLYDIIMFFRNNTVANSGVSGSRVNTAAIPKALGTKFMDRLTKWITLRKQGVELIDPTEEGANLFQHYGDFSNAISGDSINAINAILESLTVQADVVSGVPRQMLGVIEQRDAVQNVQAGMKQVSVLSLEMFKDIDRALCQGLQESLDLYKWSYKNKPKEGIYKTGTALVPFIVSPTDFSFTSYRVSVVSAGIENPKLIKIQTLATEFAKLGMVDPDVLVKIVNKKSVHEIETILQEAVAKKKEESSNIQQMQQTIESLQAELKKAQADNARLVNNASQQSKEKLALEAQVARDNTRLRERELDIMEDKNKATNKIAEKDIILKSAVVELEKEQLIFSDGKETEVNNNLI